MAPGDLKQAIYEFMRHADAYLAASETPVSVRAFNAAAMVVEHIVIEGGTRDRRPRQRYSLGQPCSPVRLKDETLKRQRFCRDRSDYGSASRSPRGEGVFGGANRFLQRAAEKYGKDGRLGRFQMHRSNGPFGSQNPQQKYSIMDVPRMRESFPATFSGSAWSTA